MTIGIYPDTASLRNVLTEQGVTAPHTGQPFTEAMLLGIGGGLGAGYILWEFKAHASANIVMGFINRWNYSVAHLTALCERLSITPTVQEFGGKKAASDALYTALERGQPVVAWVDKASLPYQQLPDLLKGYSVHLVSVHGRADGAVVVDDLAETRFAVPEATFVEARALVPSNKSRLLLADAPARIDLPAAVHAGLANHLEHLSRDSESFSLPVYKKWSKLMIDPKNKKGWPTVFKTRNGLYRTLTSVYEAIVLDGMEGCGLRGLYADFLDEAAPIVNNPALNDAAAAYRRAADAWIALAEAALPDTVFPETKTLLQQRYDLYRRGLLDERRPVVDRLAALEAAYQADFPLDGAAVSALFADLSAKLDAVYSAETAALATLRQAVHPSA